MYSSEYLQEKALAKLNLTFRVLGKLPNGMHKIQSHVVFLPKIYDYLVVKKSNTYSIDMRGKYAKELYALGGDTLIRKTIEKACALLSIQINLKVILYKNIPLGSGLGGGSADAAAIFRLLLKIYNIKIPRKKIINFLLLIGSDVPACYFSKNILLSGYGNEIKKITNIKEKKWVLVIKPSESVSTKSIFNKFEDPFSAPINFEYNFNNLIYDMKFKRNDLQNTVEKNKNYADFIKSLSKENGLFFPRMTGSGSATFLLFNSFYDAIKYKKKIILKNKSIWLRISYLYL